MTANGLKTVLSEINLHNMSEEELYSFRDILELKAVEIRRIIINRKHSKTHFHHIKNSD